MLNKKERLAKTIFSADMETLKAVYASRVKKERISLDEIENSLADDGFIRVDSALIHDKYLTTDGREIVWVRNIPYALPIEEHERRRQEALAAKGPDEPPRKYSEEKAGFLCPKCQDVLNCASVCPSCNAGRVGYKYRYSCSCGVEFVSKEKI